MKKYDLIVIGGGSGGFSTAVGASERGAKVALIEKKNIGGTCVNTGCVPKKISWFAGQIGYVMDELAPDYGFQIKDSHFSYSDMLEARNGFIDSARQGQEDTLKEKGIDVYEGQASFQSAQEIQVGEELLSADKMVIATGGRPIRPDLPGIELVETSVDFFSWESLPQSVVVIGGGYIGLELAFLLHQFGVEVQLIHSHKTPLEDFDEMIGHLLLEILDETGISFIPEKEIDEFVNQEGQILCLSEGEEQARAEKVIFAVGRQPNTDQLNLEAAQIQLLDSGHIDVDDNHQTSAEHVFAVGDVIDRIPLTPAAKQAGRSVADYLYGDKKDAKVNYDQIPTVVFIHPAIGSVGLIEEEARKNYGEENIQVYTKTLSPMLSQVAGKDEKQHYKYITQGPDEVLIGFHGIGHPIEETIQLFALFLKWGMTREQINQGTGIHPTATEDLLNF